jgi:hypothetical protein
MMDRAFTAIPNALALHPGCTVYHRAVLFALAYLADESGSLTATREKICTIADVGANSYVAARRWLLGLGAIEESAEPESRSGRRITLAWVADPTFVPALPGSNGREVAP